MYETQVISPFRLIVRVGISAGVMVRSSQLCSDIEAINRSCSRHLIFAKRGLITM